MTDFVQTLKSTGGNYSLMSTWESGQQCDLTSATTKVFSHGGITGGPFTDGETINFTSGGSGLMIGVATTTQIMLESLTGTINSSDTATGATSGASVVISDAGNSASVVLECDAFICTDTGGADISGWTTGASNYITIKPAAGAEHGGVVGAGFVYKSTNNNAVTLDIGQAYTQLIGIEVRNAAALGAIALYITATTSANVFVDKCIAEVENPNAVADGALRVARSVDTVIRNSLFINKDATYGVAAMLDQRSAGIASIYNSNFIGGVQSVDWVSAVTTCSYPIIDCIFVGPVETVVTTHDGSTGYNAFSSTGAFGANQKTIVTTFGVDFGDYANDDYVPVAGGNLAGFGTDLSATFTDDITGATR